MSQNYNVRQGDHLFGIAAKFGFRDYRIIWDDAKNAALKQKRQNPHVLYPGDVVYIPDKKEKKESIVTTKVHRFRLNEEPLNLRIVLRDFDNEPIPNMDCELEVEGHVYKLKSNSKGLIEQVIPMDAVNGTLKTKRYTWPLKIAHLNPVNDTKDDGITGIQARLRNMGYDPGKIDGMAGPRTKEAVIAFQEDNPPLKVDGVCGPETRALLVQLYGC